MRPRASTSMFVGLVIVGASATRVAASPGATSSASRPSSAVAGCAGGGAVCRPNTTATRPVTEAKRRVKRSSMRGRPRIRVGAGPVEEGDWRIWGGDPAEGRLPSLGGPNDGTRT